MTTKNLFTFTIRKYCHFSFGFRSLGPTGICFDFFKLGLIFEWGYRIND